MRDATRGATDENPPIDAHRDLDVHATTRSNLPAYSLSRTSSK
jgi:hypothetical protein